MTHVMGVRSIPVELAIVCKFLAAKRAMHPELKIGKLTDLWSKSYISAPTFQSCCGRPGPLSSCAHSSNENTLQDNFAP